MPPHPLLNKEAPTDIILKNQHDEDVSLSDMIGQKTVVLFFYPKDNTFVCTKEVCGFRDNMEEINNLGAQVIGVSADSVKSKEQFANKQKVSYSLLADTEGQLRCAYQVPKVLFGFPQRTTYVIGKDGTIQHVFESFFNAGHHVNSVLKVLKEEQTEPEVTVTEPTPATEQQQQEEE
ncbi:bacterioferritin comigratory protein [Backusella circina FSU 941]|nr:bacterioferritin comigratory protein [Backusella circina FSU 941]KAI8880097.1 bacterioferritin comigratory protein [Backusella circina FSU 941]